MHKWLVAACLAAGSCSVLAASPQVTDYQALIAANWPQANLRAEQQLWLAQQSVEAFDLCRAQGDGVRACRRAVRDGLREVLGSEPQAAAYAVRR